MPEARILVVDDDPNILEVLQTRLESQGYCVATARDGHEALEQLSAQAADLLITDASSVANEYTLLNRLIVYLDVPELIRASREKGAMVDLDSWGRRGGLVVQRPGEVEPAVAASLAEPDRLSAIRSAIAQNLFYNPGCATQAVVAWFARRFLN